MHVGGIFCDLAMAFDCANQKLLLAKFQFYDIQATDPDLFRSYLTSREKYLNEIIKYISLSLETVKYGVQWEAILGPLLFIMYTNDLAPRINALSEPVILAGTGVIISFSVKRSPVNGLLPITWP